MKKLVLVLLLLVGLTGDAPAELPAGLGDLGLDARQRQAILDLTDGAHRRQVKLRADLSILELDLQRELDKDAPDEGRVSAYVDKITQVEAEMRKVQLIAWVKTKKVLSQEQRLRLETVRDLGFAAPVPPMVPGFDGFEPFEGFEGGFDFDVPMIVPAPPVPRVPPTPPVPTVRMPRIAPPQAPVPMPDPVLAPAPPAAPGTPAMPEPVLAPELPELPEPPEPPTPRPRRAR